MTSIHTTPRSILLPSPIRPSFNDADARPRTSITIEERPRIVSRPLVVDGRRNRRRSSASQGEEVGVERKGSTGGVFGGLFSGRKKKVGKDDSAVGDGPNMDRGTTGKETSMESLEGEVIYQTLKPIPPTPTRRSSESDMPVRNDNTRYPIGRPRPPLLSLNTAPVVPRATNSSNARPQPRRRSSTRLVSPASSSRPTSPTSPSLVLPGRGGFTPFYHQAYQPPPMSAPASSSFRTSQMQMAQRNVEVPFSLTIRHQDQGPSASTRETSMFDVQEMMETVQRGAVFDPAQFEDGSDGEQLPSKGKIETTTTMVPLIGISTPPMTADSRNTEWTTPTLDVTFVQHDFNAPEMQRSDSGPPPTFKVIPATPIVPADEEPAKQGEGSAKKRDSGPPVPVNPVRPRKLALMLDSQAGFSSPSLVRNDDEPSSSSPRRPDPLVLDAFHSSGSEGGSPVDFHPAVRSPSMESLQRNTEPLRLAHSPRLVSPVTVCHPVTSSLAMASPYQSSRALALSTSSTMATTTGTSSSFDSLDTMDLEDVESALGTMLASLSTRPSLASRLTLDDPQMRDVDTYRAPEMGLSALGFGVGDSQAQPTKGRDYFPSLDSYSSREPFNVHYADDLEPRRHRESTYTSDEDGEANDSDSVCSDFDDLGSVSIAVVQKGSPAVFASPRTLSIGDTGVEKLQ